MATLIRSDIYNVESCLDGSADHTPVILNLSAGVINEGKPEKLYNHKTDWDGFRMQLEEKTNLHTPLKSPNDEACL
ncbi:unnamed protein product [Leptidea sinapis]|uniref:Uncharacterized protein n=1 Tax=Leptidea sinapis TaxID=189913 RepID=A0A5E4R2R8_9NEOP|nr:unnamed protein product [Leptidea sinapis]